MFGGEDADGWRQRAVEGSQQIGGRDGGFEFEGGDLAERVHAGVGAAGALGENRLAGEVTEGCRERRLDGGQGGLDLPAVEGGAVVGEDEFPEGHWGYLRKISCGGWCASWRGRQGTRWALAEESKLRLKRVERYGDAGFAVVPRLRLAQKRARLRSG